MLVVLFIQKPPHMRDEGRAHLAFGSAQRGVGSPHVAAVEHRLELTQLQRGRETRSDHIEPGYEFSNTQRRPSGRVDDRVDVARCAHRGTGLGQRAGRSGFEPTEADHLLLQAGHGEPRPRSDHPPRSSGEARERAHPVRDDGRV